MLDSTSADGHQTIWMSRAEVARVLQVAPVTIGRWASQGKLPYSLTLGGRRRFRRQDIAPIARELSQARIAPVQRGAPKSRRARGR
jgi:excisionase family DNA binding protein